jgi:pyruvate dehydrogenase E1 component alpha subunit
MEHFLREMLRIRLIEEEIARLYPEQQMRCPVHLSIGQEAVAVGVSAALRPDDCVFSSHRAHAHYLAKGGSVKAMLAEIYGKSTGCAKGRGGSMHLIDTSVGFMASTAIVAGTVPVGVGHAFGTAMGGRDTVTVVYFGEATMEEGVVHEAMNFAVLHKLPVLFVCENNGYSVYTPLKERQPDRDIYRWAAGYGMPVEHGDGNDVAGVFETTHTLVERIRGGEGPAFVEFSTYRWREHCGPNYDNHIGYRTEAEFETWKVRCPIARLQSRLLEQGALGDQDVTEILESIRSEIADAVRFAKESPFPHPSELMNHVYAA